VWLCGITTQHSQQTDIHANGEIRAHYLSRWAAADLRLRPYGQWALPVHIYKKWQRIDKNLLKHCAPVTMIWPKCFQIKPLFIATGYSFRCFVYKISLLRCIRVLWVETTDPGLDVTIRLNGFLLVPLIIQTKIKQCKKHDKLRFQNLQAVNFYCVRCDYGDSGEEFANI
jgi:hypothetical protein